MPYSFILLSVSKLLQFAWSLLLNSDRVEQFYLHFNWSWVFFFFLKLSFELSQCLKHWRTVYKSRFPVLHKAPLMLTELDCQWNLNGLILKDRVLEIFIQWFSWWFPCPISMRKNKENSALSLWKMHDPYHMPSIVPDTLHIGFDLFLTPTLGGFFILQVEKGCIGSV